MVVQCLATGRCWGYPKSSFQFAEYYPGPLMAKEVRGCKLRPDTEHYTCPLPACSTSHFNLLQLFYFLS